MSANSLHDGPQSRFRRIQKWLNNQWPIIRVAGVGIALVALLINQRQTNLLARQVANELSTPELQGNAHYWVAQRDGLDMVGRTMIDELFAIVFEESLQNLELSYSEILEALPAVTKSIPPAPVELFVTIENTGNSSATDVTILMEWVGEIVSVDVDSLSESVVIDGGLSTDSVVVEIARISVAETVRIRVEFAALGANDVLTLGNEAELSISNMWAAPFQAAAPTLPYIPVFRITPSDETPSFDLFRARFSSNETSMQVMDVKSPLAALGLVATNHGEALQFVGDGE